MALCIELLYGFVKMTNCATNGYTITIYVVFQTILQTRGLNLSY